MKHFITYIVRKGQSYSFVSCHPLPINYPQSVKKIEIQSSASCSRECVWMKSTVCHGPQSQADLKKPLLRHRGCVVKPPTFSTCFPTFPLLSSNLPTLFACLSTPPHPTPPPPQLLAFPMQIKRILEQPQNILLQTLEGEAAHVPVCIDGHSDSMKPKLELKSWRENFTFHPYCCLTPWHFAQGDSCWKGDKICHLYAYS